MSDPQQTTATPPPSAPTPISEATSTGTGPNQVIFENPAPVAPVEAPPAPTTPEPYRMSELENGQFEVVMESGQKFKGTQQEVVRDMAKSVYHGTKTIAELRGKVPPPPAEPPPPGIDPTALALADLAAQGLGFANASALKEYMSPLPTLQQGYQQQQLHNIAAQFLAQNTDFPNSDENGMKLDSFLAERGWEPTLENMEAAHYTLKGKGLYTRVAVPAQRQAQANPLPPNGQSSEPTGAINPYAMPFEEYENMVRQGRA